MARPKTVNQFERLRDYTVMLMEHKGLVVAIAIDHADVPLIRRHKWSVGAGKDGYLFVQTSTWKPGEGQRTMRLSRFLLDAPDGVLVDHQDRDPLNFRRYNLRLATRQQNNENRGGRSDNPAGHRGVTLQGGRYRARVQIKGKLHGLGSFDTAEEAAAVAGAFRREHMPFSHADQDCPAAAQFGKKARE